MPACLQSSQLCLMMLRLSFLLLVSCYCSGRDGADQGHVAESRHPAPPGKLVVRGLV